MFPKDRIAGSTFLDAFQTFPGCTGLNIDPFEIVFRGEFDGEVNFGVALQKSMFF